MKYHDYIDQGFSDHAASVLAEDELLCDYALYVVAVVALAALLTTVVSVL